MVLGDSSQISDGADKAVGADESDEADGSERAGGVDGVGRSGEAVVAQWFSMSQCGFEFGDIRSLVLWEWVVIQSPCFGVSRAFSRRDVFLRADRLKLA